MSEATAATYEWLYKEYTADDTWLCACWVRGLSPRETLRRLGVTPGPFDGEYGFGVAACAARGGTVLIEVGWGNVCYERAAHLSEGTVSAAVFVTPDDAAFTCCAGGRPLTTFSLYECRARQGDDPDHLQPHMRDLGMETDVEDDGWTGGPVTAALALAERATGVHLTEARYTATTLMGPTEHLPPYADVLS